MWLLAEYLMQGGRGVEAEWLWGILPHSVPAPWASVGIWGKLRHLCENWVRSFRKDCVVITFYLWNFPVNLSAQMSSAVLQSRCLTRLKVQYNCSLSLKTWIWEGSPSTSQRQGTWPACRFLLPTGGLFKYLLWRQTCKLLQGPHLYCYIILTAKVLTLHLRTLKCHEIWCFF